MKIKLVLVADYFDPLRHLESFMPLSLPILASCAPEHDYTFVDLLSDKEKKAFQNNEKYDLIGISFRVSATEKAFEIADKIRTQNIPVVLGGPQASSVPFKAIEHADAVMVGESEELWPVLLNDFQNEKLKDFYVCSPVSFDSQSYSCFQIKEFPALKKLPAPKRELYKRKYKFDLVFASRGCPIDCSFCSVSALFGKKMRFKEIAQVVAEIDKFNKLYFLIDDTVFGRPNCFEYYIELYQKLQKLKKKRFWTGQANLEAASYPLGRKVIKESAKSGFSFASIGIETINPDDISQTGIIKKLGITNDNNYIDDLKNNIRFIQEQGIAVSGWFTIGLENDTVESCLATLDFCRETNIFPVFSPIQVFEGTRLYNELVAQDRLLNTENNIINIKHKVFQNDNLIYILEKVLKTAYTRKAIFKRTLFYWRLYKKMKMGHVYFVNKLIFAIVAQLKIRKIQTKEIERFKRILKNDI